MSGDNDMDDGLEGSDRSWIDEHKERINRVSIEGNHVIIRFAEHNEYEILLAKCRTHEEILGWILHLSEKNWMTMELTRLLILKVCSHAGIQVPHA